MTLVHAAVERNIRNVMELNMDLISSRTIVNELMDKLIKLGDYL